MSEFHGFLEAVTERILVCDGAMGTALHAAGNSLDQALPAINLIDPELVGAVHSGYIDAGVDIVQTNTFGASRLRLAPFGYADQVAELNAAGVRIARAAAAAAGRSVLIAGSVSPAVTVGQRSGTSAGERTAALREQIGALAGAGIDLLILETFGFVSELVEAVGVAAEIAGVPVVAQATFVSDGRTLSGHTPQELVQALSGLPVAVLGLNCTLGPHGSLEVLTELARHTELPLSVQPNAGLPRRVSSERLEYEVDPEYFARYAERLVAAGAVIVGGCCGTTPLHIGAVAKVVQRPKPPTSAPARAVERVAPVAPAEPANWLDTTDPIIGAVLVPGTADTVPATLGSAELLRASGAQVFSIAAASASGRAPRHASMSQSVDLAARVQERLGVPAIAGVTTRNRTIMALQAQLFGAQARGVHIINCETGNPPLIGDYPTVDGTWEVDSIGLIELLAALNAGVDHNGLRIATDATFQIGGRINPGAHDLPGEIERCLRKIEAGAQYLITRGIYELRGLEQMLDAIDGAVPVLASVRTLRSFDEAEFLRYEVPDVVIPPDLMDRLERAGTGAAEVGQAAAAELAAEATKLARGVLLGTPSNHAPTLVPILQSLVTAPASR